jgi:hypothetical protein
MKPYHYSLKVGVTLLLVKLTAKLLATDHQFFLSLAHQLYQGAHIFKSKVCFIEY